MIHPVEYFISTGYTFCKDMTISEGPEQNHWRNAAAIAVTILVLLFLGLFAWRIIHFSNLIKNGEIIPGVDSFTSEQTLSKALAGLPLIEGEFNVTTTDDPSLGSPQAKVTIVEFADFNCPYSRTESFLLRSLVQRYGDKINFIFRDFPVADLHPQAELAAEAGACANEQGKFWPYHDKLFLEQSDWSREHLEQMAKELNLDTARFSSCLKSGRFTDEVKDDVAAGIIAGVRGTPTFFINGHRIPGAIPEKYLVQIIESFLKAAPK